MTTTTRTIQNGKVVTKVHGTNPCDDPRPHAGHRLNLKTMTWGCLGVPS